MTKLLSSRSGAVVPTTPRLAFFDLDGTLINSSGEISKAVLDSVAALRESGVLIAIASGRPSFSAGEIMKSLGVNAPSLFFSGALVLDPDGETVLRSSALTREEVLPLIDFVIEHDLSFELYTSHAHFVSRTTPLIDIHAEHYLKQSPIVRDLYQVVEAEEVLKAVFITESEDASQVVMDRVSGSMLQIATASGAAHDHIRYTNATAEESSREKMFHEILSIVGVSREAVIAFGDSDSDMTFLELAGAGFAMESGSEGVKRAADYIIPSVEENGVCYAIERILKGL